MNKYKISINDKNYIIYAESHEDAVKKLKDANIANTETILQKGTELIKNIKEDKNVKVEFETSYSTSNIYNKNNPEKAKLSISIMYEPDEESGWYIIEAYIKFEDNKAMKLGLRQSDTKQGAIQALREIITKARKSIKDSGISDYQPKEISYKRIEDLPLKSRQELQNSKNKEATLLSIEGNIEDIINAANPEIKGDLQRIGSKILNDLRKQFKITDNKIKDDNNSEYRKELAKWQDLYINKKLITSSELSEKAKELKQKYNIKDEKLTSKQIIEKAKSFGGQAKQNGATGVLGISITSPQGSDEFAEWLEKNNIHYNSDGRQYYVEIQDCEIGDKLIQSGSEEAFKKNIATEIRAGKDPKQAAAIAYNVQRENDSKVKDKGRYKIKHPVRNEYLSVFGTFVEPSSDYIITFASEDEARKHYKQYGDKDINIKIVKDSSTIKDSSDYIINYKNSYTGERNKETIKANSAIEAIKKFADAVALRGYGTRNINIISISPNDGYVRLYGSLQSLLKSREFRDCNTVVNDTEPKNWTYVMFGTTGEKKVENLTKAEAEHLLKNNKLLGYSGKIYETVRDNDTNNTNKILDSGIVVAKSLDELISKIKSWDGETTTNYILSPKSSGWYFDYFITMGYKYSYYAYIKKTAHGRHDNPNVDISKQNIDKTVTAKTAQELIDQVVRILK